MQRRLPVIIKDVQQTWIWRYPYQTERSLDETLHDCDVQLPA
jgi:hypothetical protein